MTLDELGANLPNGFHDAEVSSLRIDYVRREVVLDLAVWVGDLSSKKLGECEAYRPGRLTLSGLHFCVIEPPSPGSRPGPEGAITIDTGPVGGLAEPPTCRLPDALPAGSFTNWFFVHEWNAFLYIAASQAHLHWQGETERRDFA